MPHRCHGGVLHLRTQALRHLLGHLQAGLWQQHQKLFTAHPAQHITTA